MKQNSIRVKMMVYLVAFIVFILIFLWFFQIFSLEKYYEQIKLNDINSAAGVIEKSVNKKNAVNIIDNVAENTETCVLICRPSGAIVYSLCVQQDCLIHKLSVNDRLALIEKSINSENRQSLDRFYRYTAEGSPRWIGEDEDLPNSQKGFESVILTRNISLENDNQLVLLLNTNISPVASTVRTLSTQFALISFLLVAFSLIISFFISRQIAGPIENLNKKAKILATGNYDVVFDNTGYMEISELAQTLNYSVGELSKVEQLRRDLISNISHDLRTPLTMISGYGQAMIDIPGEANAENAKIIVEEAERLTSLVNDVIEINKLQTGAMTANFTTFSLTELIEESIARYEKFVKDDGFTITFEKYEESFVKADKIKIGQALFNLINNAITYSGEDKRILIRQTRFSGFVKVEVIDYGIGISEEELPFIWDRYFRAKENHRRASQGSGLGLSIVKAAIEIHPGASCSVKSKLGEGSNFSFTLREVL